MDDQVMDEAFEEIYKGLESACESGSLSEVRSLLPDIRLKTADIDYDLSHLISCASIRGHSHIVRYLLLEGITLELMTPIRTARGARDPADARYIDCIRACVEHGWDVNNDDKTWGTALHQALRNQNVPMIEYLLLHGADVNMVGMRQARPRRCRKAPYGISVATRPLDTAAAYCSPEIIQTLIENGAQLSKSNALHKAATAESSDRIPVLQFLLDQGMDVNALEYLDAEYGNAAGNRTVGTPLHYAASQGRVSIVKFLLDHGADPGKHSSHNLKTPFDWIEDSEEGDRMRVEENTRTELRVLLARKKPCSMRIE